MLLNLLLQIEMQQTEAMEQGREGSEEKEEQLTAQQKIEVGQHSLNLVQF